MWIFNKGGFRMSLSDKICKNKNFHIIPVLHIPDVKEFIKEFRPNLKELNDLLTFNQIFIDRTANVGILPAESAINYGITGPNLRASGVNWDLRINDPYSIYDRFDFEIPVGKGENGTVGDCWDRYYIRILEMESK